MKKEAVSKQEIAPRSQKVQNNGRGCSKIALKNIAAAVGVRHREGL